MRFKGMDFKVCRNLLCRIAKEGDVYANGKPITKPYYVVVKVSDCEYLRTEGFTQIYNTDNAPSITDMTGHSLTNMVYGKWKKRKSEMGVWVENIDSGSRVREIAHEYYQMTVYLVRNRRVYKASIQRAITPKQIQIVNNG